MSLVHSGASASIPTCDASKTVADILTAAADLIDKPGGWTKGTFARTKDGRNTGWKDADAECFCVAGALLRSGGAGHFNRAWDVFNDWTRARGFQHLASWNDSPSRTQAEVVAALRAAAEKARTVVEGPSVGIAAGDEPKTLPTNGDSQ